MSNGKITAWKILGMVATGAGSIGALAWGVPYYIDRQVDRRVEAEFVKSPHPVTAAQYGVTAAQVVTIEATVIRMEQKMDARDAVILKYFQDKASEADDN